ncbi:MAG: DUF2167 domain-containing protein [Bacteroidia bacterium]|jgi:uncharacterized membrane-anchored protein|nr:DUF2167 domain-containing protein [Bacteroidia bacterium]
MKRFFLFLLLSVALTAATYADSSDSSSLNSDELNYLNKLLHADSTVTFQTGVIQASEEITLNIPKGYKFIGKKDAEMIVFEIWGNPSTLGILGMIVKEDYRVTNITDWAFVVSYENSGYVKDDDASDVDYTELMKEIQASEVEENKERVARGYDAIHVLGWASEPFYDQEQHILHWAKSMVFGENGDTTLNYDVRILGRRGILSLNAVGSIGQLNDIKSHINQIIKIATFTEGNQYKDFNPDVDQVAAYTVGGLIAGKVLAKVGVFAFLLKYIKLIVLGGIALIGGFGKRIIGMFRKKEEETITPVNEEPTNNEEEPKA